MRRLNILFFWLFVNKNNVSFRELLQFLFKPTIGVISKKHVEEIKENSNFEVSFRNMPDKLHWPKGFSLDRLDQVVAETFDTNDWHYYQKEHTEVEKGEIILDIGTAEGLFPLTVIDKCEHVYMIEPSQSFSSCLKKTFASRNDRTTLFEVAVGNMDGQIAFDENSVEGRVNQNPEEGTYPVEICKIDTLFKNGQKITYLKADIEGFEEEMLKGAEQTIKRNKPKIAITTYHTQNDPSEIISIVKGFVPEYKHYVKGIYEQTPKPVMIHFWI